MLLIKQFYQSYRQFQIHITDRWLLLIKDALILKQYWYERVNINTLVDTENMFGEDNFIIV